MKKILVVGGSGTIGSAFIDEFYNEYKFSSISRNELLQAELKRKFPKVNIYFSDIESQDNLTTIFSKVKPATSMFISLSCDNSLSKKSCSHCEYSATLLSANL